MVHEYHGKCLCGSVTIILRLPLPLDNYVPRACDCDFCTSLGLTYLSDPSGTLELLSAALLIRSTQGSGQAIFLSCTKCRVIVAVVYIFEAGIKGNVNAALIDERKRLQEPVTVSPKLLEPAEKVERWDKLWFPVILHEGG